MCLVADLSPAMNAAFLLGDLDFPSSFDNFAAMRSFFRCSSLGKGEQEADEEDELDEVFEEDELLVGEEMLAGKD